MQGKRQDFDGLKSGEYGRNPKDGKWYCCTPNGHYGNLSGHDVTEHEDGTITVSPSIAVSNDTGELWHGYLEHGIWREV
jgi:hypothetical protein